MYNININKNITKINEKTVANNKVLVSVYMYFKAICYQK